jgi:hypothetical protein
MPAERYRKLATKLHAEASDEETLELKAELSTCLDYALRPIEIAKPMSTSSMEDKLPMHDKLMLLSIAFGLGAALHGITGY